MGENIPGGQGMDHKGEEVDLGLFLDVDDAGLPVQLGQQVEIVALPQVALGQDGGHAALDHCGRPAGGLAAVQALRADGGHGGDQGGDAPLFQIILIFRAGILGHHGLALEVAGRIAADGRHVPGQDLGPLEGGGTALGAGETGLGKDPAKGLVVGDFQNALGESLHGHLARGRAGQVVIDHRFGPAPVLGEGGHAIGQALVVQPRGQQHMLAGEDPRLDVIDQADGPTLERAPHPSSADQGCGFGGGVQAVGVDVADLVVAQLQQAGRTVQGDGIHGRISVPLFDQAHDLVDIAATAHAVDLESLS